MHLPSLFVRFSQLPTNVAHNLQWLILLLLRLYIASVFLKSGFQKVSHWDSTLILFEYEYSVPFLSAKLAAILGTVAEIGLPLLLLFGVMSRWGAFALFCFNIVAVASYPALNVGEWAFVKAFGFLPIGISFPTKGLEDHVMWGLMIFTLFVFGAGKVSIDYLLSRKLQ
ncbi:MAG: DoxX family protein [Ostreibacterium sp.]